MCVADFTDCDDTDEDVYPGATELLCNNVDDDCDGTIDEGRVNGCTDVAACNFNPLATCDNGSCTYPFTLYLDFDGDGYGDIASPLTACSHPAKYVADFSDCDDTDEDVYPAQPNCSATTLMMIVMEQ
ncbi:MAG: putative metal-binding motif-containing protein [Flavobacteriales bacterium]|nr:putative metal-binding motif-containing protein [Flavobacteriales bacterium]